MKLLITNDDGYFAPGIAALARALAKDNELYIVAPKFNQSCVSHGLTLKKPLTVEPISIDGVCARLALCVDGTPADCTRFALQHLMLKPDAVISGINQAGNIGTDVLYSGTVSAAAEAAMLGVRSIAVSRDTLAVDYFDDAAAHFAENLDLFYSCTNDNKRLLNVNYPFIPAKEYRGIRAGYLAEQVYADGYTRVELDSGGEGFITPSEKLTECPENDTSDEKYIRDGFITVTPLKYDITDYEHLARIASLVEKNYNNG